MAIIKVKYLTLQANIMKAESESIKVIISFPFFSCVSQVQSWQHFNEQSGNNYFKVSEDIHAIGSET